MTLHILSLFLGASFPWEAGQEQVCVLGVGGGGETDICWPGKWLLEDKETGPESSPASRPLCRGALESRRWLGERMHSRRGQQEGRWKERARASFLWGPHGARRVLYPPEI